MPSTIGAGEPRPQANWLSPTTDDSKAARLKNAKSDDVLNLPRAASSPSHGRGKRKNQNLSDGDPKAFAADAENYDASDRCFAFSAASDRAAAGGLSPAVDTERRLSLVFGRMTRLGSEYSTVDSVTSQNPEAENRKAVLSRLDMAFSALLADSTTAQCLTLTDPSNARIALARRLLENDSSDAIVDDKDAFYNSSRNGVIILEPASTTENRGGKRTSQVGTNDGGRPQGPESKEPSLLPGPEVADGGSGKPAEKGLIPTVTGNKDPTGLRIATHAATLASAREMKSPGAETPSTAIKRGLATPLQKDKLRTGQWGSDGSLLHTLGRTSDEVPSDPGTALLALKRGGKFQMGCSVPSALSKLAEDSPGSDLGGGVREDEGPLGLTITTGQMDGLNLVAVNASPEVPATGRKRSNSESIYLPSSSGPAADTGPGPSPQQPETAGAADGKPSSLPPEIPRAKGIKDSAGAVLLKIVHQIRDTHNSRTMQVEPGTTARQIVERMCRYFDHADDWMYALYNAKTNSWIPEYASVNSLPASGCIVLQMRQKTPDFLEAAMPSRTNQPARLAIADQAHPPPKVVSIASFTGMFSRADAVLKTKLKPDNVYLSVLLFGRDKRILMTANGLLPTVTIQKGSSDSFDAGCEEFGWLLKVAMDWEKPDGVADPTATKGAAGSRASVNAANPDDDAANAADSEPYGFAGVATRGEAVRTDSKKSFRFLFYKAANRLRETLDLRALGVVYDSPVQCASSNSKLVTAVQYVSDDVMPEISQNLVKNGALKWRPPETLDPTVYDRSNILWSNPVRALEARRMLLSPGLYIGVFHLQSTMERMNILVPSKRNTFIPVEKVREDSAIRPEEMQWLRAFTFRQQEQVAGLADAGQDPVLPPPPSSRAQPGENDGAAFTKPFMRSFCRLQSQTGLRLSPSGLHLDRVIEIRFNEGGSTFTTIKTEEELQTPSSASDDDGRPSPDSESRGGDRPLPSDAIGAPYHSAPKGGTADGETGQLASTGSQVRNGTGDPGSAAEQQQRTPRGMARVLVFVCPMRTASSPRPATLNVERFAMFPLPLFESMCHHTYNSAVYDPFRRTMISLQETICVLQSELKFCLAKSGYPDITDNTLDERYRHAQQMGALADKARRIKMAMSILEEELANLNSNWRKMNWCMKLILWVGRRHSLEFRTVFSAVATPVTAASIKSI